MKLIVAESLYRAERFVEVFRLPKDEWRIGDLGEPFVANQFDEIVVVVPSKQHLNKEWVTTMDRLGKLLKPGKELTLI